MCRPMGNDGHAPRYIRHTGYNGSSLEASRTNMCYSSSIYSISSLARHTLPHYWCQGQKSVGGTWTFGDGKIYQRRMLCPFTQTMIPTHFCSCSQRSTHGHCTPFSTPGWGSPSFKRSQGGCLALWSSPDRSTLGIGLGLWGKIWINALCIVNKRLVLCHYTAKSPHISTKNLGQR